MIQEFHHAICGHYALESCSRTFYTNHAFLQLTRRQPTLITVVSRLPPADRRVLTV